MKTEMPNLVYTRWMANCCQFQMIWKLVIKTHSSTNKTKTWLETRIVKGGCIYYSPDCMKVFKALAEINKYQIWFILVCYCSWWVDGL